MNAPVIELYRAAQSLESQAFHAFAFGWLDARLPLEQCIVVTTYQQHASWVDAHFFGIDDPRALMASHEKVRHLDRFTARLFANPMVAASTHGGAREMSGPRYAPLREHLRRFGGWRFVAIAVHSPERRTATVVMACRGEHARRFGRRDVASMQALGPHLAEAAAVNRAVWLPRTAAGTRPVALLDADGRFVQTTDAFVRLFWPHAPPATAYVDDAVLRALRARRPWLLPDGAHALYGEPDASGSWHLRIRVASPFDRLTAREREVATLFAHGTSYKVIAKRLGLSPTTVRNHLQNLYGKLEVTQRDELLRVITKA